MSSLGSHAVRGGECTAVLKRYLQYYGVDLQICFVVSDYCNDVMSSFRAYLPVGRTV